MSDTYQAEIEVTGTVWVEFDAEDADEARDIAVEYADVRGLDDADFYVRAVKMYDGGS
jgi:glycine betaine/choline ABC-type transport system substrate-binding protein